MRSDPSNIPLRITPDRHGAGEDGFTLIELLAVIACLGVLAALGISMFLSGRKTAGDGAAKELMNTAQNTAVIYGLSNGYTLITPTVLNSQQPSLNIRANGNAILAAAAATASGFTLSVVSSSANTFNVTSSNGVASRTCIVARGNGNTSTNTGDGCNNGSW